MSARYLIRPKADEDLEDQAWYLATEASPEVAHRFLLAAHETFALLASHPNMGRRLRLTKPKTASLRVFRVSGFRRMLVLYLPRREGVDILRVIHGSRNIFALLHREGI